MTISYETNPSFRGYMRVGVEHTGGAVDVREQMELATEYPKRSSIDACTCMASSDTCIPPYERLKSPANPWPDSVLPSLRPCTEEYTQGVLSVANRLREAICVALGLQRNALDELFGVNEEVVDPPHWVLKLISYPYSSQSNTDNAAKQQGVGAHTDTNFLTLVLQDYSGGLQVFTRGQWVDVPADSGPDLLVCNLGEQAEILTRGYFLATPHRVMRNTASIPRTSVPLFYNPRLSAVVKPINEKTPAAGKEQNISLRREREDTGGGSNHWRMKGNIYLDSVGENTFKSLARSHPIIFQALHPDIKMLPNGEIVYK